MNARFVYLKKKMENILNKLKLNIGWDVVNKTDPKKLVRPLLILLVAFMWIFVGCLLLENKKIKETKIPLAHLPIARNEFKGKIENMVAGFPIAKMSKQIVRQDKTTAALMVAIAKKESNWGKRKPVLNGQDCFNYWGYREKRDRMGSGGHTCFDSPEDAVATVSKRINTLVTEYERNTPEKMIIWKCGLSCNKDNQANVKKWISDVDIYYQKLIEE